MTSIPVKRFRVKDVDLRGPSDVAWSQPRKLSPASLPAGINPVLTPLSGATQTMRAMKESLHIGRIAGIRIGANWSLLPILVLIVWGLAVAQLPHAAPGYTVGSYYITATWACLLFYGCLLAHELASALSSERADHGLGKMKRRPTAGSLDLHQAQLAPMPYGLPFDTEDRDISIERDVGPNQSDDLAPRRPSAKATMYAASRRLPFIALRKAWPCSGGEGPPLTLWDPRSLGGGYRLPAPTRWRK